MKIGILREKNPERRVAMIPDVIKEVKAKHNIDFLVESGAGEESGFSDDNYRQVEADISSREEIFKNTDVIAAVSEPNEDEIQKITKKQLLMSVFNPLTNKKYVDKLLEQGVTSFSLDNIPRTTRAQAMDVLSSQATSAGYKAVIHAADKLPELFPMFMTAAGTIKPAKVLVLGAGVAGLQAIATARRLGAVVNAFDVRTAVKEEVQSLGAKFVEVEGAKEDKDAGGYAVEQSEEFKKKQMEIVQEYVVKSDVVISTAQIPGKKAPVLITEDTVKKMKNGSVIVDLAASGGGNCELTENDKTIKKHAVTITGESNFPSNIPSSSSLMYSKNLMNFLKLFIDEENNLKIDFEDDIVSGTCVTHKGEIISDRIKKQYLNN